jgi:hypothetical protein
MRKGKGCFPANCCAQNPHRQNYLQKNEKDFEPMSKSATLQRPWVIETLNTEKERP